MTEKTKHYLFVGGGLAAAVIVAIVVYKKIEAGGQASQAAADQSNQDALALLEASSLNSPYGSGALTGSMISLPSAAPQQSLAQEIASIEASFGFAPTAPAAASPAASPSQPANPPAKGTGGGSNPPSRLPVPPKPQYVVSDFHSEPPLLRLEHEEFIN